MSKIYHFLFTFYSLLFSPLIVLVLACCYFYRRIVEIVLRVQLKNKFAGLLNGSDCIWAVEEPSALSVNNILLILEKDARHSNAIFLESFRDLVKTRILSLSHEKLLYKRNKKYGYYFWEKIEEIDLKERVRWLEYERTNCDGSCDNVYNGHLKRVLWNVCNQPLPDNHTASWEILIGKCCPRSSHHYLRRLEERLTSRIRIPVLFRVHHSLGDGMALLRFFRDVIVDKEPIHETYLHLDHTNFRIKTDEVKKAKEIARFNALESCNYIQKDITSAIMPFIHFVIFSQVFQCVKGQFMDGLKILQGTNVQDLKDGLKEFIAKEKDRLKEFFFEKVFVKVEKFLKITMIVVCAPSCLIQQALRSMDKSTLHGADLSGEKLVSYWMEDDFKNSSEQRLFTKIQNIKSITGARFGDVILAALSVSLHKYFLRINEPAPDTISVVMPMKLEGWSEIRPLQNNFSVGILSLCISQINDKILANPIQNSQIFERLEYVKNTNDSLKKSSDYKVNFLVIKYLSAVLPEKLLRPILKSHSTMVFSNLVGPQEVKILGHFLKNIAFWIPNRSLTGIGCSLLTYRGYLHLSLVADKALVKNEKALKEILENTMNEIDNLYERLTLSFFSKKLRRSMSTPMKKAVGVL